MKTNRIIIVGCFENYNLKLQFIDLILSLPQIVMPTLAINQLISIPPEELEFPTLSGSTIKIPIPSSHVGKKPIHVRLLSSKRRIGMVSKNVEFL
jgi:hypothetical protein